MINALLEFGRSGERLPPSHVLGIDREPPGPPDPDEPTHFIPATARGDRP